MCVLAELAGIVRKVEIDAQHWCVSIRDRIRPRKEEVGLMKRGMYLALALVALTSAVSADTVVVKPSDMGDWVTGLTNAVGGAYVKFFDPAPPKQSAIDPEGTNDGALYGVTGIGLGSLPNDEEGSLWVGTNLYNGTRLDQITTIKYHTWTDDAGIWQTRTPGPYRQLNPPRQPFRPRLLINRNDGSGKQSWLIHCPYGTAGGGLPGSGTERQGFPQRQWQEYDAVAAGGWLEIKNDEPNLSSFTLHTSWLAVLTAYPEATIAGAPAVGSQWPLFLAPTGCALNFFAGAQQRSGNVNGLNIHSAWSNWWRDAYQMRYWLDDVTIGVLNEEQQEVVTTYDFEADASAPTVAIGGTDARTSRAAVGIYSRTTNGTTCFRSDCKGSDDFTFVVYGKVLETPPPGLNRFYITDGGLRMEVVVPKPDASPVVAGQWVRCTGHLQMDYGGPYNTVGNVSDWDDYPSGDPDPIQGVGGPVVPPDMHPRLLCAVEDIVELPLE